MTTRADPLSRAPEPPDRVVFATGVLLDADDFRAEQLYHRGRLARAVAYLHGHGTVAGLRVVHEPATAEREERVVVRPGLAVDRLGRLVELPSDACLRLDRWFQAQTDAHLAAAFRPAGGEIVADVFIRFVACERGRTPAFATGPYDALDAAQPSRLRDGCEVTLVVRQEPEPPPVPPTWPAPAPDATPEARAAALRELVLDGWRETDASWTRSGLAPLPEHAIGQDTTAVFLARVRLPATQGAPASRPTRAAGAVTVDNQLRRLVVPTGALAAWMGS